VSVLLRKWYIASRRCVAGRMLPRERDRDPLFFDVFFSLCNQAKVVSTSFNQRSDVTRSDVIDV
jgi:hypothetical protein